MKNLKKIMVLCSLALVFTVLFAGASFAQGSSGGVMEVATNKAVGLFKHVKTIIFVVGGFGLVGIAFQAIFGKVKWTWFAGLAVGLGILAAASAIINYATGDSTAGGKNLGDTFLNSGTGGIGSGS